MENEGRNETETPLCKDLPKYVNGLCCCRNKRTKKKRNHNIKFPINVMGIEAIHHITQIIKSSQLPLPFHLTRRGTRKGTGENQRSLR